MRRTILHRQHPQQQGVSLIRRLELLLGIMAIEYVLLFVIIVVA